jgi:hypothetical protein
MPLMPWVRRVLLLALVAAGVAGGPREAVAAPNEEAIKLADEGFDLMNQRKFAEAVKRFQRAIDLYYSPVIMLYWVKAEVGLGHLVQAHALTRKIIGNPLPSDALPSWTKAHEEAGALEKSLAARIPRLTVVVPSGTQVWLDEKLVGAGEELEVNPGSHRVDAERADKARTFEDVELAEGERRKLELSFDDAGLVPLSLVPPIVAFSVGAAGLVLGTVSGILFLGKADELEESCPEETCPPDKEELLDETTTLGDVATAGWVIAILGAAAGTVLLLVPIDGGGSAELRIGPGSLGAAVKF